MGQGHVWCLYLISGRTGAVWEGLSMKSLRGVRTTFRPDHAHVALSLPVELSPGLLGPPEARCCPLLTAEAMMLYFQAHI